MNAKLIALTAALLVLSPPRAQALCVSCSCTVTANPMNFGTFSPLANASLDVSSSIDTHCTGVAGLLAGFDLKIGPGLYGSAAVRQMRSGSDSLNYNLYLDAARTTIWGDGTGGFSALNVQNFLSLLTWSRNTPVYGRIPAAPSAKPGNYSDTVVVTVEW